MNSFSLPRGYQNLPALTCGNEPYDRRSAYAFLMERAALKPELSALHGYGITLKRGQYAASLRFLAEAWKWSTSKVQRFLNRLRTDALISASTDKGVMVITLCNFNEIQAAGRRPDTPQTDRADTGVNDPRYKSPKTPTVNVESTCNTPEGSGEMAGKSQPVSGQLDLVDFIQAMPAPVEVVAPPPVVESPVLTVVPAAQPPVPAPVEPDPPKRGKPALKLVPKDAAQERAIATEMVEIWNEICGPRTRRILSISDKRMALMNRVFRKGLGGSMDAWRQACLKISRTPFLCGMGGQGWKVDMIWCLEGDHLISIMEGKYDGECRSGAVEKNGLVTYAKARICEQFGDPEGGSNPWGWE